MKNRLTHNLAILEILKSYMVKNPDLRFNQVLRILELVNYKYDPVEFFYEEPHDTLRRLHSTLDRLKNKE